LAEKGTVAKLAVIATALLAAVGCFAYVGGWLSPHRLTQAEIIDTFEEVSGVHSGFRRNHAKGVCITGNSRATARVRASRRRRSSGRGGFPSSAACRWPAASPTWPTVRRRYALWG
jgi:hypothetical protein